MRLCCTRLAIGTLILLIVVLATVSSATAALLTILPLGDSITFGIGSYGNVAYRLRLWQDFGSDPNAVDFLGSQHGFAAALGDKDHEGFSGYAIDSIKSNLAGNSNDADNNGGFWLTGTSSRPAIFPEIILLHIGTNDISRGADAATAAGRLDGLINEIFTLRPDTTLIVASLIPRTDASLEGITQQYNALIPGLVAKNSEAGKSIYFVDMHKELTVSDLADEVHPNQGGYTKMGDAWFDAIQAIPEPGTLMLLITGSVLAAAVAWRRKK
jgi:lysophospholipase L1-like esterase